MGEETRIKLFGCLFTLHSSVRKNGKLSVGCSSALDRMEFDKKKHSGDDHHKSHGYYPCTEDIKKVCKIDIHDGSFYPPGKDMDAATKAKTMECNKLLKTARESGGISQKCYAAMDEGDKWRANMDACRSDALSFCQLEMPADIGDMFWSEKNRTALFGCLGTLSMSVRKEGKLSSECSSAIDRMEEAKKKHSVPDSRKSRHGNCPCTADILSVCGIDIHSARYKMSDHSNPKFYEKVSRCKLLLKQAREYGG